MNMRFGTWIIKRADSLVTVSRELYRYRVDLVGVQEVRWEGNGTAPAGEYNFYMEREMRTMIKVQAFWRESCQQLRWFSLLVIGCHTYY
jgi:hypothetical protein